MTKKRDRNTINGLNNIILDVNKVLQENRALRAQVKDLKEALGEATEAFFTGDAQQKTALDVCIETRDTPFKQYLKNAALD